LVRQIHEGDRLHITGFTGPYTLPDDIESQTDHLVHVVAGSGAVPNFAMVKDCLHRGLNLRHTFLCSNKTWHDIPFRDLLSELQRRYPEQLRVVHTLTQEQGSGRFRGDVRQGRISLALFHELIPSPSSCVVYACGPANGPWEKKRAKAEGKPLTPRFLETAMAFLRELGVPDQRIKRESYG
jgi:ferredoxin-NADP reductase